MAENANNDSDGQGDDGRNDQEVNNTKSASTASLYNKLINIGLNDGMIGQAITHIKFKENADVIKEGFLRKESIHLKKVRQRWMVLKGKYLYSYKEMQAYHDPTEIFDLKLFRTAKMVKNGKTSGQFELISVKQEKRIFIAQNKCDMNEWIRYIKKVILFSKDFSNKCRTIRSCLSIKRLSNIIRLHSHYSPYKDGYLRYIHSYKQLINDYHHVLDYHLNEYSSSNTHCNTNKSYELIQKTLNFYCNINFCECYQRNNRIHEQDMDEEIHNHDVNVYRDLLDTIHCTLLHAFDNGLKIKHKEFQSLLSKEPEFKDNNQHFIDTPLKELKKYLWSHKKRLQRVRGQKNRFLKSKFFLDAMHKKPLRSLKLNEEKQTDKFHYDNRCEFGRKFVYWDSCKSSPYYIGKKYDNLKLELMDNIFCPLEISKFIETHIRATILLQQSNVIKQIRSDGNNAFGIGMNASLCLENIMALIFYCDFDVLTSHLLCTYHINDALIERSHREFCIWSKLLNETVQCFGNRVNESEIETYYVCTMTQYFDKFMVHFNRPTSMTTNLHISTMFCSDNGIILEMKKTNFYIGELLRYFDCTFVSSFSGDDEKLFIGGCQSLQLVSIRSMRMNECYRHFILPFVYFQKIMSGKDILQLLFNSDYLIISNLISSKIINKKSHLYPKYIIECFDKYCSEQRKICINLRWLYNFSKNFVHLQCPNLLLFDNLSILFKEAEAIYCGCTGVINSLYLSSLIVILQHVNTNKYNNRKKKLTKIVLSGVEDIKLSDSEFLQYTNLIHDKVQWTLEQTDDSVLTLIKCVV